MRISSVNSFENGINTDQPKPRWFIDLDWYQQNNRSFFTLARSVLCPMCCERLRAGESEVSAAELLSTIKDCCSKTLGFINPNLPILECIFRLLLANGNQPLGLEELEAELAEWRGRDTYRTSAEVLSRLLDSDQHYGFQQATQSLE